MTKAKTTINLFRGWPSPSLLPIPQVRAATQRTLADASIAVPGMLYGPDPGYQGLRDALARWLTAFYQPQRTIEPSRITISSGASQALGCVLSTFTDPVFTRRIWVITPAYYLAFPIFEDAGFGAKMRSLKEDGRGGVDVDWLKREVKKVEDAKRAEGEETTSIKSHARYGKLYRHIIYAVPSFANPSSTTMPLDRRRELVACARDIDALIICDDVYDMLQWPVDRNSPTSALDTARLPRLVDIDRTWNGGAEREKADGFGNAISNGSFSKICGPGCRTGWVEGTNKFSYRLSQTGTNRSGGAASQLTATFMADLVTTGELQKHIRETLQPAYGSRYRTMMMAIEEYLSPLGVQTHHLETDVVGGYFIWLTLPAPLDSREVASECLEKENLVVAQGRSFEVPGDHDRVHYSNNIRLCFAWEDEQLLVSGVERLARVILYLQNKQEA